MCLLASGFFAPILSIKARTFSTFEVGGVPVEEVLSGTATTTSPSHKADLGRERGNEITQQEGEVGVSSSYDFQNGPDTLDGMRPIISPISS